VGLPLSNLMFPDGPPAADIAAMSAQSSPATGFSGGGGISHAARFTCPRGFSPAARFSRLRGFSPAARFTRLRGFSPAACSGSIAA
jgi:hypothetical protein